ncbi:MAG: bidirectional hydrogenase complex protein HoxU [Gemmataceae bacterium]|nr:bidirectional hydrogenase complex protein HoxU [Gemmataceae bacterium]
MAVITFNIDGKDVTARAADTILTVARESGINIPTLCCLDGLSTVGACRLCLVEVKGSPRLFPSCTTRATEGMQVRTATDKLREYRKMILELLLAERNHICSVCVANGHCELQDQAAAAGVDHNRFEYQYPNLGVDISHERFGLDHNRCILCTRCVRACDEIEGAHTWDVSGRGRNALVIVDMNQSWGTSSTCTSCGKCVQSCPTGALFPRGTTVAESERDRTLVNFLKVAREKKQWLD